jgi:hypothetical protein
MNLRPLLFLIGTGTAGLMSCGDKQITGPTEGTIMVGAVTTGADFDPNGYLFSVNNGTPKTIGLLDTVYVTALEAGSYEVRLSGIEENCVPADGTNPQTTQVLAGDTVAVLFDVACEAVSPPPGGGGGNLRTKR